MGSYINPRDESKEEWLAKHAQKIERLPAWEDLPAGCLPVCLVQNHSFTAAGIAYSPQEYEVFKTPDPRPKWWYIAKTEELKAVSDLELWLAHEGD